MGRAPLLSSGFAAAFPVGPTMTGCSLGSLGALKGCRRLGLATISLEPKVYLKLWQSKVITTNRVDLNVVVVVVSGGAPKSPLASNGHN